MVSKLDSGSSGPGSSPGRGHRAVFLGKTPNSHSASLHPAWWAGLRGHLGSYADFTLLPISQKGDKL